MENLDGLILVTPQSRAERLSKIVIIGALHAGGACTLITLLALVARHFDILPLTACIAICALAAGAGAVGAGALERRFGATRVLAPSLVIAGVLNAALTMLTTLFGGEPIYLFSFLALATAQHAFHVRLTGRIVLLFWSSNNAVGFEPNLRLVTILGGYLGAALAAMLSHTVAAENLLFGQGAAAAIAMSIYTFSSRRLNPSQRRLRSKPWPDCLREMRQEGLFAPFLANSFVKSALLFWVMYMLFAQVQGLSDYEVPRLISVYSLGIAGSFSLAVLLYMLLAHGAYQTWKLPLILTVFPFLGLSTATIAIAETALLGHYLFVLGGLAVIIALHVPVFLMMASALNVKERGQRAGITFGWGAFAGLFLATGLASAVPGSLDVPVPVAVLVVGILIVLADLVAKAAFENYLQNKMISGNHLERFQAIAIAPMFRSQRVIDGLKRVLEDPNDVIRTNAILALGELRTAPVADILTPYLEDRNLFVRSAAIKALESTRNKEALKRIVRKVVAEQQVVYKTQLISMFKGMQRREIIPTLVRLSKDNNARIRANALEALDTVLDEDDPRAFDTRREDPVPRVRIAAIVGSWRRSDKSGRSDCFRQLEGMFGSEKSEERMAAVWGMGKLGQTGRLVNSLKDPELSVRRVAVRAMEQLDEQELVFPLMEQLSVDDEHYNQLTLTALLRLRSYITMETLEPFLQLSNPTLQRNIGHLLLRVHVPGCEEIVRNLLQSDDPHLQLIALKTASAHDLSELDDDVKQMTGSAVPEIVSASLNTLAQLSGSGKISNLEELLENPEPHIRSNALLALARADGRENVKEIAKFIADPDHRVRAIAGMILVGLDDERGLTTLNAMLHSEKKWEIVSAIYVLGELKRLQFLPHVLAFQHHIDPDVQRHVKMATQKIDRGLDKDIKKLRNYLGQIEQKLQPSLEYLITYLNTSEDTADRFAVDLLSQITSGQIRDQLSRSASSAADRYADTLKQVVTEPSLKALDAAELVELLQALIGREPLENQAKVLAALKKRSPLDPEINAELIRWGKNLMQRMEHGLSQLLDLVTINQESIVQPLIRALRARVLLQIRMMLELAGLLSQMSTRFLVRQLDNETPAVDRLCETIEAFELPDDLKAYPDFLRRFYLELPERSKAPKHELDINMILELVNSDDAALKSVALAGVGNLVTNQFLRILSDTLSRQNPTLQMISLQTLEQIKAILSR